MSARDLSWAWHWNALDICFRKLIQYNNSPVLIRLLLSKSCDLLSEISIFPLPAQLNFDNIDYDSSRFVSGMALKCLRRLVRKFKPISSILIKLLHSPFNYAFVDRMLYSVLPNIEKNKIVKAAGVWSTLEAKNSSDISNCLEEEASPGWVYLWY